MLEMLRRPSIGWWKEEERSCEKGKKLKVNIKQYDAE